MRVITLSMAICALGCVPENGLSGDVSTTLEPNPARCTPEVHTDTIKQVLPAEIDILWVVDNSCSMSDKQQKLADNFPVFLDWFLGSNIDYHIGVVSTDMSDTRHTGKLQPGHSRLWIDPETPSPHQAFA
jgi:hypothetical protein